MSYKSFTNFASVLRTSASLLAVNHVKIVFRMTKEDYDNEPVYYCKQCLSLNIRQFPNLPDRWYCGDCGTSETAEASFDEWKEMYRKRYGHDFIVKRERKWPYWFDTDIV